MRNVIFVIAITLALVSCNEKNKKPELFGEFIFNSMKSKSFEGLEKYLFKPENAKKILEKLNMSEKDKRKALNETEQLEVQLRNKVLEKKYFEYIHACESSNENYWEKAQYKNTNFKWLFEDGMYFCTLEIVYEYEKNLKKVDFECICPTKNELLILDLNYY